MVSEANDNAPSVSSDPSSSFLLTEKKITVFSDSISPSIFICMHTLYRPDFSYISSYISFSIITF